MITLHNRYFLMRHAQSVANEKHIIISDPKIALENYGLTPLGETQVMQAIAHNKWLYSADCIYSSDFLRAYETALLIARTLHLPLFTDHRLRERYFGQFEGTNSENYHTVWDMDCKFEHDTSCFDVEPIGFVARRMMSFLLDCESKHTNTTLLVVSHGDPLQILYSIANGLPPQQFKTLPHFTNAEIRKLPSQFFADEVFLP